MTLEAKRGGPTITAGLETASLAGVRIGVMRKQTGNRADLNAVFDNRAGRSGTPRVAVAGRYRVRTQWRDGIATVSTVLMFELREEMGKYLGSIPAFAGEETPRSLADLIAFNAAKCR